MQLLTTSTVRNVVWTIYDHPRDYPKYIALRPHYVTSDGTTLPGHVELFDTVDEARSRLPVGLMRFPRSAGDDPDILESWL